MMIFTRIKVTKMSIKKYLHDTAKLSWFWKEYFHSSKMKRRLSPFVARQMQTNVSSFLGKVASGCKSWLRSFLTIHHLYCKRSCNTNLRPFDQKLKGFPARTTSILAYFTGLWLVQIQNIWPFALTKSPAQHIWHLFEQDAFTKSWIVIWPERLHKLFWLYFDKRLAQNFQHVIWSTLTKCLHKISELILSWHIWLAIRQKGLHKI